MSNSIRFLKKIFVAYINLNCIKYVIVQSETVNRKPKGVRCRLHTERKTRTQTYKHTPIPDTRRERETDINKETTHTIYARHTYRHTHAKHTQILHTNKDTLQSHIDKYSYLTLISRYAHTTPVACTHRHISKTSQKHTSPHTATY